MLRAIARASRRIAGVDCRRALAPARDARRAVGTFVGAEQEELTYAPTKKVRSSDGDDDAGRDDGVGARW